MKSSLYLQYFAEAFSGGAHLRPLTPGHHSYEETSQRWQAVGVTGPGFESQTSCTDYNDLATEPTGLTFGLFYFKFAIGLFF